MEAAVAKMSDAMAGKIDCCDKAVKTEKSKSCASNCAAMCGVTIATDTYVTYQAPLLVTTPLLFAAPSVSASVNILRYTDPPPRLHA